MIVNCLQCGREVEKPPCRCKGNIFCSSSCAYTFRRGKPFRHDGQFKKGHDTWNKGATGTQTAWNKGLSADVSESVRKSAKARTGQKRRPIPKSDEWRRKVSEAHKRRVELGLNNLYIDGRSGGPKDRRQTVDYNIWRSAVFKRDDWTCQEPTCRKRGGRLEAHHIKRWAEYPELRYEVSNGLTLCKECHKTVTFSKAA